MTTSHAHSLASTTSIIVAEATGKPDVSVPIAWSGATFIVYRIFELILGRVPWFIYDVLSYTITATVTLDFWGILYILTLFSIGAFIFMRTKLLDQYKRLAPTAAVSRNEFDLKPDTKIDDNIQVSSYPDEFMNAFLSSIKVFGYLDKPVFHELAKSLQTKTLSAGELLYDIGSEDRDFYIVVDGAIEIYIKNKNEGDETDGSEDDSDFGDEWSKHFMLNKVKAGGTVTSLFSILSILTEDMKLPDMLVPLDTTNQFSRNEGERIIPSSEKNSNALPNEFNDSHLEENETNMDLQHASSTSNNMNPDNSADSQSSQKSLSEMHENVGDFGENDPTKSETSRNQKKRSKIQSRFKSVHPNLVAKASRTTKLAVIPSSSFKSLCEKYPKAGSHMVQVILTRFQRVTFLTMHKYLGLSSELLAIEKKLNENADGGLSMARFNQKSIEDLAWKLSHQHIDEQSRSSDSYSPKETRGKRPFVEIGESDAGVDLGFSDIERKQRQYFNEIRQPRIFISDEDEDIKDAVFESIAQLIGLTAKNVCLSAQSSSRGNAAFKTKGRSIEPLIERFYYGRSPKFAGSQSASTISRTFDIDEISMNSIISAAEQADDADVPDVELKYFTQGEILLKEGDRSNGLYFVLDGVIEASTSAGKELLGDQWVWTRSQSNHSPRRRKREAFLIHPGSLAGYLSALTGNPSFVTLKAKTDILVGMMPKIILDRYVEKYPNVLLYLAKRLVDQLSPLVFHIDVALEWGQINAGQSLCRQGDKSQSIFIVLTGRLRSIKDNEDNESNSFEILGEYGPSESVGEFEVLLDAPRSSTIHAIRDSEVAIMPKSLFNALAVQHPEIMMTISRMIALRSKQAQETRKVGTNNENMKTVAFLPVSKEVPIVEFAELLKGAMDRMNVGTRILDTRIITKQLGKYAFTKLGRLRLISWLAEQEENHRLVMYVADGGVNSPWTHRCIRQADCVIVVGLGDADPSISEPEQLLLSMKTTARKELVLLHPQRACTPGTTSSWLKLRLWIHAHHHIQMSVPPSTGMNSRESNGTAANLGDHFQKYYNTQVSNASPNIFSGPRSDFSRLARRLLSKSIGLVLGGGGAKGLAHVGLIRAFEEYGIPVDMVGGTSMGAFVGGVLARENDQVSVYGRAKMFCRRMTSTWRMAIDLTYPIVSMTTGHEFNMCVWKAFFDTQIEDCWLPFFAISTNITFSRMEVNQQGYMWRYVRSSMSLSGFLPPLCDNGSMLMDGGYLNNVPADVMRDLGAKVIVAVDVGSAEDNTLMNYGDTLSGWWVLLNSFNPFAKGGKIPTLNDIQSKLAYTSSVPLREKTAKMEGCYYLRPPICQYQTMDFAKFKEIEQIGYDYATKIIQEWNEKGILEEQFGVKLVKPSSFARRASI